MGKFNLQTSKKRVGKASDEEIVDGPDAAAGAPGAPGADPEVPDVTVGIETVDHVDMRLHEFSSHLGRHMPKYVAAVVFLGLAGAGVAYWMHARHAKNADKSVTLFTAVTAAQAPTKETLESEGGIIALLSQQDPEAAKKKKVEPPFATDADKWKAALETAEKSKGELSDGHALLAGGVAARAQLAVGKPADAAKGFGELATGVEGLQGVALESQGNAAWAAGDAAGAAAAYEKLAGLSDLYYRVRGTTLLGDLNNPSMGGKDAAKAKAQYEKALELLKPSEGQVFTQSLRALRGELSRRRAQL